MRVKYVRVSTLDQKTDRQQKFDGEMYIDKCSGSIPFAERPSAKKLIKDIDKGIKEVCVHSIDRCGRNTLDVLKTIQFFTSKGINVVSEKEGLQTLLPDGRENPTAKLIINILASVAEMERNNNLERQKEGIAIAKAKGVYNKPKSKYKSRKPLSRTKLLEKHKEVVKMLKRGNRYEEIREKQGVSFGTISKISKLI